MMAGKKAKSSACFPTSLSSALGTLVAWSGRIRSGWGQEIPEDPSSPQLVVLEAMEGMGELRAQQALICTVAARRVHGHASCERTA